MFFAVEDFSTSVPSLAWDEQETQVAAQLTRSDLHVVTGSADARKTCESDRSFVGLRPAAILRYEMPDLSPLPDEALQKAAYGKYHSASVGACHPSGNSQFARFRIAILFF
jgi:hypothetical protein